MASTSTLWLPRAVAEVQRQGFGGDRGGEDGDPGLCAGRTSGSGGAWTGGAGRPLVCCLQAESKASS